MQTKRITFSRRRSNLVAGLCFGAVLAIVVGSMVYDASLRPPGDALTLLDMSFMVIPIIGFAAVGALIVARLPRHPIGWLMLLPGLSLNFFGDAVVRPYLVGLLPAPTIPSPWLLLVIWFIHWNWLLLVWPLIYFMLLFPDGRPLPGRWRHLVTYGLTAAVVVIVTPTFDVRLSPVIARGVLDYANPLALPRLVPLLHAIQHLYVVTLPLWVVLCALAMFRRYRRADAGGRKQIKWAAFGVAISVAAYLPVFIFQTYRDPDHVLNSIWGFSMLAAPAGIGIGILRHRLYDIDIIIRKTVQYTLVSALLALVYFGSVVLVQGVFNTAVGDSPLLIVLTTLAIAALFNPLRRHVQEAIDRRFYRQKYDAQQVLAQFAQTCRDEADLDKLTAELARTVQETLEPESVSVWIRRE